MGLLNFCPSIPSHCVTVDHSLHPQALFGPEPQGRGAGLQLSSFCRYFSHGFLEFGDLWEALIQLVGNSNSFRCAFQRKLSLPQLLLPLRSPTKLICFRALSWRSNPSNQRGSSLSPISSCASSFLIAYLMNHLDASVPNKSLQFCLTKLLRTSSLQLRYPPGTPFCSQFFELSVEMDWEL